MTGNKFIDEGAGIFHYLLGRDRGLVKNIVYEMRFDEVSAKYGGFGEFYINLRLEPEFLWEHLNL